MYQMTFLSSYWIIFFLIMTGRVTQKYRIHLNIYTLCAHYLAVNCFILTKSVAFSFHLFVLNFKYSSNYCSYYIVKFKSLFTYYLRILLITLHHPLSHSLPSFLLFSGIISFYPSAYSVIIIPLTRPAKNQILFLT